MKLHFLPLRHKDIQLELSLIGNYDVYIQCTFSLLSVCEMYRGYINVGFKTVMLACLSSPLTHTAKRKFTVSKAPDYSIDPNPKWLHVWHFQRPFPSQCHPICLKLKETNTTGIRYLPHYEAPQIRA